MRLLVGIAALALAVTSVVLYLVLVPKHHPCTHGASSTAGYLKNGVFHYTRRPHATGCTRR